MTFEEAMKEIESHELSARLNVASDMTLFLIGAQREMSFSVILDNLTSPDNMYSLFKRVIELSHQTPDIRYENQWDTALAVYLWLFNMKDQDMAKTLASIVAKTPQCWWAKILSYNILLSKEICDGTNTKIFNINEECFEKQNTHVSEIILPIVLFSHINESGKKHLIYNVGNKQIKSARELIIDLGPREIFSKKTSNSTETIHFKAA